MTESCVQTEHTRIGLSGNVLKVIAAITMLIDHIGYLLFPGNLLLRIIGRLAYPIYAFMIAEGCRYTQNKLRYFLGIFILAIVCQTVYFVVVQDPGLSILVTYSISILLIYAWQFCQKAFSEAGVGKRILSVLLLITLITAVYVLNLFVTVDYGFWGSMVPLIAGLFMRRDGKESKMDRKVVHVSMLGIGLLLLSMEYGYIQPYCLLALPLLYLYNGQRGKRKMKYFFYIFYPAHLVVLQGIYLLLQLF